MEIYVDELPETIAKSSNEDDVNTTEVRMWFKSDVKISPLSDRLSEERKKVVKEIRKKVEKNLVRMQEEGVYGTSLAIGWYEISRVLDQIEENLSNKN